MLPPWVLIVNALTYVLVTWILSYNEGLSQNTVVTITIGILCVLLIHLNQVKWLFWISIASVPILVNLSITSINLAPNESRILSATLGACFIVYVIFWPWFYYQYVPIGPTATDRNSAGGPDESKALSETISSRIVSEKSTQISTDDYAIELNLFEQGDLNASLWAKHLVEAEGDTEKAKWKYIKERVFSAPERRAEALRLKQEQEELKAAQKQKLALEEKSRIQKQQQEVLKLKEEKNLREKGVIQKALEKRRKIDRERRNNKIFAVMCVCIGIFFIVSIFENS